MAAYSRWEDAMIAQARIVEWYRSRDGMGYLQAFVTSMNGKHRPEARMEAKTLAAIHVKMMLEAEPIWMSGDATEIVDHARHSFEPEEVLPTDPFATCGFVLFPRAMIVDDAPLTEANPLRAQNGEIPVRAVAWMPMHSEDLSIGCFWICYFVHVEDESQDNRKWSDSDRDYMRRFAPLSLVHQWQWSWGTNPWTDPEQLDIQEGESIEETVVRARQQAQLIQTLWRIGSQFIPVKERASRQLRRDARRKGMKHDEVTVITLRRGKTYEEREPTGRELTVRHLVRGYWARRHTREGIRQVWVRPHVRGDDSLPFRATTRAWEFRR